MAERRCDGRPPSGLALCREAARVCVRRTANPINLARFVNRNRGFYNFKTNRARFERSGAGAARRRAVRRRTARIDRSSLRFIHSPDGRRSIRTRAPSTISGGAAQSLRGASLLNSHVQHPPARKAQLSAGFCIARRNGYSPAVGALIHFNE